MAEKEKQSEHKSTIDKYFRRTADGFKAWAEEDEEERNYMQIAAETTGDVDEDGNQSYDLHISYHGKAGYLADGIAQAMQRDKFLRTVVLTAARKFFFDK
nr:MAG: hypothetical protein [Bacteriophage sp.]